MSRSLDRDLAEIAVRLLDDAYMAWLAAETESEQALSAWFEGKAGNRGAAYFAYRAALDREHTAALDLQRLHELAQPCCDSFTLRDRGRPGT